MKTKRLGLALSGGGIRAAIFHMGVLTHLARIGQFDNIKSISSVSGASLVIGLIFAVCNNTWPSAAQFYSSVEPQVRARILSRNIQANALRHLPFLPRYWRNRVLLLARQLEHCWGISGNLQDLPIAPFWEINCTTFETGGNFRFRRDYMGEKGIGYVQAPKIPLSHVIAASAAFPVLIGPYTLRTQGLIWTRDKYGLIPTNPLKKTYSLWDGGVYDNLGVDALYKPGRGLDGEIDYLIVSNASASLGDAKHRAHASIANLRRLLEITTTRMDVLREQQIATSIVAQGNAAHLRLQHAGNYPTTLNSPTPSDYELIFQLGINSARDNLRNV